MRTATKAKGGRGGLQSKNKNYSMPSREDSAEELLQLAPRFLCGPLKGLKPKVN